MKRAGPRRDEAVHRGEVRQIQALNKEVTVACFRADLFDGRLGGFWSPDSHGHRRPGTRQCFHRLNADASSAAVGEGVFASRSMPWITSLAVEWKPNGVEIVRIS